MKATLYQHEIALPIGKTELLFRCDLDSRTIAIVMLDRFQEISWRDYTNCNIYIIRWQRCCCVSLVDSSSL